MNVFIKYAIVAAVNGIALSAWAANEIQQQKVQSTVYSRYGTTRQTVKFDAIVANLGYQKQVYAHLRDNSGNWIDVPLNYNRSISNNREVWTGTYAPTDGQYDVRYALKYVVNGQTYWDNNNGSDYLIARSGGSRLADGVNVYNADFASTVTVPASQTYYPGSVTVRNLSPTKQVRVHYTTDNWVTTQIANATYSPYYWTGGYVSTQNPNSYGFEEWSYALTIGSANQVKYAVEYSVNGQTYWDNNFGLNYSVTIVRN